MSIQTIGGICSSLVVIGIVLLTMWGALSDASPVRSLIIRFAEMMSRPLGWANDLLEYLAARVQSSGPAIPFMLVIVATGIVLIGLFILNIIVLLVTGKTVFQLK